MAGQVCAFASRPSRNAKSRPRRFCETNPIFSTLGFLTYSDRSQLRASGSEEAAGIEFIDENGGGPGVRLRRQDKSGDQGFYENEGGAGVEFRRIPPVTAVSVN